jgi:DNA-binding MurR/RpiR family transcriptional regulator
MVNSPRPSAQPAPAMAPAPTAEQLLAAIRDAFDSLSRQLKQIARYVEQHRDQIGLDRIQDVARNSGVQPSAVIRFAKRFGFSGYSEMQKIFRDGIAQQIGAGAATTRPASAASSTSAEGRLSSADIADEFIAGSIAGMQEFRRGLAGRHLRPRGGPAGGRRRPSG